MIRVEIAEHQPTDTASYTLRVVDGYNRNILLSSTSQRYSNRAFAVDLAKRLFAIPAGAPSGTEEAELWFIAADGAEAKLAALR